MIKGTTISQENQFAEDVVAIPTLKYCIDWIEENLLPDEVFSDKELSDWAADNGFVKEEK